MDSPNLLLISYDEPPAAVAAAIDEGLGQANEAAAPLHEVRPLACAARLGDERSSAGPSAARGACAANCSSCGCIRRTDGAASAHGWYASSSRRPRAVAA